VLYFQPTRGNESRQRVYSPEYFAFHIRQLLLRLLCRPGWGWWGLTGHWFRSVAVM